MADLVRVHRHGSQEQNHNHGQYVDDVAEQLQARISSDVLRFDTANVTFPWRTGKLVTDRSTMRLRHGSRSLSIVKCVQQRRIASALSRLGRVHPIRAERSRSEFPMTLTEDSAMAAAAITGESVNPKNG